MNKKGNLFAILIIIGGLLLLVVAGIMMVFGSATLNFVFDTVVPEFTGIGVVGNTNISEASELVLTPVDTVVQNFTWLTGIIYILGIIAVLGVAFAFRGSANKWMIGLFFAMVLLLVISCIILSNIYEEFYGENEEIGSRLREHTMLSFLILYSPQIMAFVAFIAGIILFSGGEEQFI